MGQKGCNFLNEKHTWQWGHISFITSNTDFIAVSRLAFSSGVGDKNSQKSTISANQPSQEKIQKKTKRKLSAKQVCTKTKSNGFSTFMQLKHWASEFAIPTKPTAFELRLGHKSRCLRLDWRDRLGEGVTIWVFAGYVQGEEIGGGGIGRIALWRGEGDFVAENGVLVGVWWIIGGDNKWTDSVVEDGFGNLRLFLLLFHW